MSQIISIGTAVPGNRHSQEDILRFMHETYKMDNVEKRKLAFLYHQSGIKSRHSVIADFSQPAENRSFLPTNLFADYPTIEQRQAIYDQQALPLALEAVKDCLQTLRDKPKITHLITVSCTGMSAPGLDLKLCKALNLPPDVVRTSVNFMGCYAAIHAMKMADWICKAEEHASILIVSVELCTLHFQKEFSADNATSSLLFADGAAAVLISNQIPVSGKGLRLKGFYSWVNTNGDAEMTWSLSRQGFKMTLSSYIPHLLSTDIEPVVDEALSAKGYKRADITHWCIHPGGKRILQVLEKQLKLEPGSFQEAYRILASHGNMSSATILFVLKQMQDNLEPTAKPALIFGAAFGPGLTMETFLAESL